MPEASQQTVESIKQNVIVVLRTIRDPEIPINIFDLGLIYNLDVAETGEVRIQMTLTAPNCPAAASMPGVVQSKVGATPGVTDVKVDLTWDPPWSLARISEAAQLQLGFGPADGARRRSRFNP